MAHLSNMELVKESEECSDLLLQHPFSFYISRLNIEPQHDHFPKEISYSIVPFRPFPIFPGSMFIPVRLTLGFWISTPGPFCF